MATESRMEPEADAKLGAGPTGKDPELLVIGQIKSAHFDLGVFVPLLRRCKGLKR